MKNLYFAVTLFVALFITACGGDDDEIIESPSNYLVGTWSGARYDGTDKDSKGNRMLMLIFKSDGSGTFTEQIDDYKNSGTFHYVMEGSNKGKIRFNDDAIYEYFFLCGDKFLKF